MSPRVEVVGQRFGRVVVLREVEPRVYRDSGRLGGINKHRRFAVRCDCGNVVETEGNGLRSGHTRSCGCLQREVAGALNRKHGEWNRTSEYNSWRGMIERCEYPKAKRYKHYGGRGITVCARWRRSFAAFLRDMGRKPSPRHSIDRYPDADGDYRPKNCRWATPEQQQRNKRKRK